MNCVEFEIKYFANQPKIDNINNFKAHASTLNFVKFIRRITLQPNNATIPNIGT